MEEIFIVWVAFIVFMAISAVLYNLISGWREKMRLKKDSLLLELKIVQERRRQLDPMAGLENK